MLVDPWINSLLSPIALIKKFLKERDEDFKDGPPCLATFIYSIMKDPQFDGKDQIHV